jgi:hypothetical protein
VDAYDQRLVEDARQGASYKSYIHEHDEGAKEFCEAVKPLMANLRELIG